MKRVSLIKLGIGMLVAGICWLAADTSSWAAGAPVSGASAGTPASGASAAAPVSGASAAAPSSDVAAPAPSRADYLRIAGEVEANLRTDVLDKFFPAAVDKKGGGFFENFGTDWKRLPTLDKNIVYQARLTWLAAAAAPREPGRRAQLLDISRHGIAFMAGTMWDAGRGGFYWAVNSAGQPAGDHPDEKHVYGIAFGIYAAAGSYAATGDPAALDLAKRAFLWLDDHAHDAANGGYYEALTLDGAPILHAGAHRADAIGTRYGYKSMNTHIHLLEALSSLYGVWKDDRVKARLDEVFKIVRDRIYVDPGCLHMFFNPDWRPVPELDSFGHDIETAYLLAEAAEALGEGTDKPANQATDQLTRTASRRLVDHALRYGFDAQNGGFYNEATAFGRDVGREKIWWVQAEGLNALLLMHERHGASDSRYWRAFTQEWAFISRHQVDQQYGGWINTLNADGSAPPGRNKADRWTEGYHQGRALLNVSAALHRLAGK